MSCQKRPGGGGGGAGAKVERLLQSGQFEAFSSTGYSACVAK